MVTLINAGRTAITVMLLHATTQTRYGQSVLNKATGTSARRNVTLSVPSSVTLSPGETLSDLPNETAGYPDVLAAKARGLKVLITAEADLTPVEPAPKSQPPRRKGK